jgi:hypothetical protein
MNTRKKKEYRRKRHAYTDLCQDDPGIPEYDVEAERLLYSRLPYVIRDFKALMQRAAAGHPVVVMQNLGLSWYPKRHYAMVIGYELEKQIVTLCSGKIRCDTTEKDPPCSG